MHKLVVMIAMLWVGGLLAATEIHAAGSAHFVVVQEVIAPGGGPAAAPSFLVQLSTLGGEIAGRTQMSTSFRVVRGRISTASRSAAQEWSFYE